MTDDGPAADVLENGVVARRIGQRQMKRRKLVGHVRNIGRDQREGFPCKHLDGFGYRCEVVEHILRPQRNRKPGAHPIPDGNSDSASHSRLAANPFSFIPSAVAMLYAEAMTLPYFDLLSIECSPASPFRLIPGERSTDRLRYPLSSPSSGLSG